MLLGISSEKVMFLQMLHPRFTAFIFGKKVWLICLCIRCFDKYSMYFDFKILISLPCIYFDDLVLHQLFLIAHMTE